MKKMSQKILNPRFVMAVKHEMFQPGIKLFTVLVLVLSAAGLFYACNKESVSGIDKSIQSQLDTLDQQASSELQQAWEATSKYQNIQNAFADNYADIHVVMPNMGYHYMKSDFVDSVFDFKHPELLVYNKRADSSFQLVAIEYAIPLDKSANAPEGFPGNSDVWDHNTDFGLWLLHAWVWKYNPAGVFSPTNPSVQVIQ
jgi:hypothetical protein